MTIFKQFIFVITLAVLTTFISSKRVEQSTSVTLGSTGSQTSYTTSTATATFSQNAYQSFDTKSDFPNEFEKTIQIVLSALLSVIGPALTSLERTLHTLSPNLSRAIREMTNLYGGSQSPINDLQSFLQQHGVITSLSLIIEATILRAGYQYYFIVFSVLKHVYRKCQWMLNDPMRAKAVLLDIFTNLVVLAKNIVVALKHSDNSAVASSVWAFFRDTHGSLDAVGLGINSTEMLFSVMGLVLKLMLIKKGNYKEYYGVKLLSYLYDYFQKPSQKRY